MIVKITEYDPKKGFGKYQEVTKQKQIQAFRYTKFKDEKLIPVGSFAIIKKGRLVKISIGFWRKLWFKLTGVL